MPPTILITGASGFIGFHVLLAALTAGYNTRFTVRSEDKARTVSSNPAMQKIAPGSRLSPVIIPDFMADDAFDLALQGVTHVIHVGSPVPYPTYDPITQIMEPTLKIASNLLASALRTPSIQRIVITSSIVANLGITPDPSAGVPSAATLASLPDPLPSTFNHVFEAYVVSRILERHNTENFINTQKPHFTVSHITPGYVYGRNELASDTTMMQERNSSNNFLIVGMLGGELPFPIYNGFVHIEDLVDIHLRAAFDSEITAIGVASHIDYESVFMHVEKAFPKAVAEGVFKKGTILPIPIQYNSDDAKRLLGSLRSFEGAVVDVAAQYLEILGKEKA
jgi:nucleoside-diphosphate-sugar epimerase